MPYSCQITYIRESYTRLKAQTGEKKDNTPFTVPPETVARKIVQALESAHPKARYYVTVPAYILAFLRCVLPTRWMDALLARI